MGLSFFRYFTLLGGFFHLASGGLQKRRFGAYAFLFPGGR